MKVEALDWEVMSEDAHMSCFKEVKPVSTERIDFALLVTEDEKALGYVTCRELDGQSVYLQFGGCFPTVRYGALAYKAYMAGIEYLKSLYKNISYYVKNDNVPMLKFALKSGFKVVGVKNKNGDILLEHTLI